LHSSEKIAPAVNRLTSAASAASGSAPTSGQARKPTTRKEVKARQKWQREKVGKGHTGKKLKRHRPLKEVCTSAHRSE
jgi:hypothetical protein